MRSFESHEYHGPAKLHLEDGSILAVLVWLDRCEEAIEGWIVSEHDPSYFSELAYGKNCALEYRDTPWLRVVFPDPKSQRFKGSKPEVAS
jgi:hypothetical protein